MSTKSTTTSTVVETARIHSILRFACGVTAAFAVSEAMGWYPTFLAPILTATLLASMPSALPVRGGVALIGIQACGAFASFALAASLRDTPIVLFGAIGLIIFVSFATIARGRGFLPILLVLICFSTIPIVTMVSPSEARALPMAYVRGMAVAVATIWLVHIFWPRLAAKEMKTSSADLVAPVQLALAGTAIVLPVMLVYLMYGITDALPVLITTVVLVVNFDRSRSTAQGMAMMIGNFLGGAIALICYALLQIAPSLATLILISFIVTLLFAMRLERGGPGAAVGLVTLNQAIIMFSLSLLPGSSSAGIWTARLLQFAMACAFAIGMMILLLPRPSVRSR